MDLKGLGTPIIPAHAERHLLDDFIVKGGRRPSQFAPANDQIVGDVFRFPSCGNERPAPYFRPTDDWPDKCPCGLRMRLLCDGLWIWK